MPSPSLIEPLLPTVRRDCSDLAVEQPTPSNPVQRFFFVVLPALIGFFGLLGLIFVQVLISKDFLEE